MNRYYSIPVILFFLISTFAAAEADQYGWDYSLLYNTLMFYHFGDQGLLNGPFDNLQDAFDYAQPLVIAEQPDSCPVMLDTLGAIFYVK